MNLVFRAWHVPEQKMYYRAYQKLFHVLLCEDDRGTQAGRGRPAYRARHSDCILMESTGLVDRNGREIFEGDILRVTADGRSFVDRVHDVPDMYRSRKLHPLDETLRRHGIEGTPARLDLEVLGNEHEHPHLAEPGR